MAKSRAHRIIAAWLDGRLIDQKTLAKLLSEQIGRNVSQSSISYIKRGAKPKSDVVAGLAIVLGVRDVDWLPENDSDRPAA